MLETLTYTLISLMHREFGNLRRFLKSQNVTQHTAGPTHKGGHTLDLVIGRESDSLVDEVIVFSSEISDHKSVCFNLIHSKPSRHIRYSSGRNRRVLNKQEYRADLVNALSSSVFTDDANPDELLTHHTDAMQQVLGKHAPLVTRKRQHKEQHPRYDVAMHQMRREKRQFKRQWRRTGLEVHRQMYIILNVPA